MVDRLKRCNLVNACMSKNSNLFDEIKRQRKCNQTSFATSIDGHNRESKYEKLYNSVEDDGSLFEIEEKLDSKIPRLNDQHINLLTSEIMKTASQKLKHRKSDPQLSITSDFFVRTPIFYDLLSSILKSYIVHAHVTIEPDSNC